MTGTSLLNCSNLGAKLNPYFTIPNPSSKQAPPRYSKQKLNPVDLSTSTSTNPQRHKLIPPELPATTFSSLLDALLPLLHSPNSSPHSSRGIACHYTQNKSYSLYHALKKHLTGFCPAPSSYPIPASLSSHLPLLHQPVLAPFTSDSSPHQELPSHILYYVESPSECKTHQARELFLFSNI